jgi:hypothetical protein
MQVPISEAVPMIVGFLKAKLVPLLTGSPGCGKSQIVYQIAKEHNLKVIDLRLSQCDSTDLAGFPTIQGDKADYVPMKHFPIVGDPVPDGYAGWLLFLDEITSAPPSIQAASYKLVLDRMVGSHPLHSKVAIVAAGNLETDNAVVQPMSTALQSRLVHLQLQVSVTEWISWAASQGLDHRISDYIAFKPSALFTFQPDHTDNTYACPRTWEFANRVLKVSEEGSARRLAMLAGCLSEGVAREFVTHCAIYQELPKLKDILATPLSTKVPSEPSHLFAMTGSLSHHSTPETIEPIMAYVNRFGTEMQVIMVTDLVRRKPQMSKNPTIQKWIVSTAHEIF